MPDVLLWPPYAHITHTCTRTDMHTHSKQTNPQDLKIELRDKVESFYFLKIIYFEINSVQ